MTKKEAVDQFKRLYTFLFTERVDYWTAQLTWAAYTDSLCKGNQITARQFNTWGAPFPYGKNLKPDKWMVH